jgi:UrcA family protein
MDMRKIVLLAAALMIATPAAGEAWKVGNNSYRLYLTDLDLRSAAGRAEALTRVERVAARLCTEGVRARRQECVARTVQTSTTGSARDALKLALEERASTRLASRPSN